MDSVILYCQLTVQNLKTILPNLLSECLLRILLLLGIILMQFKYHPQEQYITEAEILGYKKPRRESYVPPWAMILTVIFFPLVVFSLPLILAKQYVGAVQALLGWSLALLLNGIFTEFLKMVVKRPRPDFFYRCFPNGIITYQLQCTGDLQDVVDGRKSFPSGHSSFAFCSLGFLSMWLYGELSIPTNMNVGTNIFCSLPIFLAGLIGFSRCCDNHHHWQDVVVGSLIGFICSYVCYQIYCKSHNRISNHRSSQRNSE